MVNLEVGDKKLYYKGGCSKDIFLSILRNFWEKLFCNFCMGLQTHLKSNCYVGGASDSWYMIDCAAQNSQTLNMIFWKRVVAAIFSLSRATTPLSLLWLSRFSFFSVKQKLVSGFFNTVFFKFNFFYHIFTLQVVTKKIGIVFERVSVHNFQHDYFNSPRKISKKNYVCHGKVYCGNLWLGNKVFLWLNYEKISFSCKAWSFSASFFI